MAGSINLSLSQQFDKLNGDLLSGGRLYFYAAGTDSPQDAFKDTGLTLAHPNPITLASDARIPQLYFADGSIHVRLTDPGGVVQFDEDNVLVVGPSDGGGGGGGGTSVDPTKLFQTGFVTWLPTTGTLGGWVQLNGNSIGDAFSSATERHNADCEALFLALWNGYADSVCPVTPGGRGANALADWSNHRAIGLLDFREIVLGGLSTMGAVAGDRGGFADAAVPVERGNHNAAASIVGAVTHQLLTAQMPAHAHDLPALNDPGHAHTVPTGSSGSITAPLGGGPTIALPGGSIGTSSATTGITLASTVTSTNGGSAFHNNTPRTILGTFYQKL